MTAQQRKTKAQLEAEIKRMQRKMEEMRDGSIPVEDAELQKAVGFGAFAHDIIKGIDLKPIAVKAVLGFIWGYTVMSVSGSVVSAIALLAMPAWITFMVNVLVVMCFLYAALATVVPVTNFTYNSASDLVSWVRKEYAVAKSWAADAIHDYKSEEAMKQAKRELNATPAAAH